MSYICEKCNERTESGTKAIKRVLRVKRHKHPKRLKTVPYREEGKIKKGDDPGGDGYQIDKEILVCQDCAKTTIDVSTQMPRQTANLAETMEGRLAASFDPEGNPQGRERWFQERI